MDYYLIIVIGNTNRRKISFRLLIIKNENDNKYFNRINLYINMINTSMIFSMQEC
jgi:hypothetical protein